MALGNWNRAWSGALDVWVGWEDISVVFYSLG
jgi:hypothetical protein